MSTNNSKVQTVIEAAFQTAIDRLAADTAGNLLSDLYAQVDQETGELQIYDEEEHLIEKTIIVEHIVKRFLEVFYNFWTDSLTTFILSEVYNLIRKIVCINFFTSSAVNTFLAH